MAIATRSTTGPPGEQRTRDGRRNGALRPSQKAGDTDARVEQAAHDDAVRLAVAEVARVLQDTLGQSLTGLIADVRNVKAVRLWARGERTPHPEAAQRLRHAYHVVQLLRPVEQPATIRAWFLGLNPLLDDTPPAIALRTDPVAVLKAARAFALHG
jgi:hypothetical protein